MQSSLADSSRPVDHPRFRHRRPPPLTHPPALAADAANTKTPEISLRGLCASGSKAATFTPLAHQSDSA